MESKKRTEGIGLYPEDWDRITRLRERRESKIEFIETALQHEFERRERPKPRAMTSLTEL